MPEDGNHRKLEYADGTALYRAYVRKSIQYAGGLG